MAITCDLCDTLGVTLGPLLRQLRTDRGLTQPELSARARVSVATISNIERRAEAEVQPSTAKMLLAALDQTYPLSDEDRRAWLVAAGMPLAEPADRPQTIAAVQRAAPPLVREAAFAAQVRQWFEWLLDADEAQHISYEQLCHAMIGVATTLGVRLPTPTHATVIEALTFGGRAWPGAVAAPGTTIGDRSTTVYSPTSPPP
ncbi:MAG: helix-turn-helix domain-containing protein, partial [Phycisphaerales bacterium]|nr:helix-turn-helix domain-containing protein [Phycisphaerales bacterium]